MRDHDLISGGIALWLAEQPSDDEIRNTIIEECAQIAVQFGEFPGEKFIKELRVMCATVIAEKILALKHSPDALQDRGGK